MNLSRFQLIFIIAFGIILTVLISLPFWPERYGDSYSEQQRKLWNDLSLCSDRVLRQVFNKPKWKNNLQLAQQLQNSDAPDWNVIPGVPQNPNLLPPEGMTFDELLDYAGTNKNADAFLLLLSSPSLTHGWFDNSSNQRFQFMKKWITKAHELQRPGTDFLLRILDEKEKQHDCWNQTYSDINDIPGYDQFKQLIYSGDFLLYKTLMVIRPDLRNIALGQQLELTLERKARQGDVTAQRQLGEYGFFNVNGIFTSIQEEMERPRSRFIVWLVKEMKKRRIDWFSISKTMDTSPTRDKLNEYAAWLHKAADAGDLVAMYLWLNHGVDFLNYLDKKDWNDIFRYYDTLLKTGFDWKFESTRNSWSWQIIQRYYSPKSLKRVTANGREALFARGSELETLGRIIENNWNDHSREYNLDLLERARRQNPGFLIFGFFDKEKIKDNVVSQRFADIIRETANGGDPWFMYMLADMIRQGMATTEDPEEITRLLETAWPLSLKYDAFLSLSSGFFHELVVNNLMTIYLLETPTLENQQKAFELAQQYNHVKVNSPAIAHFYLSLIYQKGYGTPSNLEKEQYHYQQFLKNTNRHSIKEKLKNLIKQFDYQIPK